MSPLPRYLPTATGQAVFASPDRAQQQAGTSARAAMGAYELHLPADGVTIWYVVTPHDGNEVISIQ